ncbi:MAG TPA: hypothetical protein VH092_23965 [Urbifossiella sp.]|nr:hypothetical protein [Urbifossiella sp.]
MKARNAAAEEFERSVSKVLTEAQQKRVSRVALQVRSARNLETALTAPGGAGFAGGLKPESVAFASRLPQPGVGRKPATRARKVRLDRDGRPRPGRCPRSGTRWQW